MSSFSVTEPSNRQKWLAGSLVILYAVITILPLVWIMMTGFKTPPDSISYPPKVVFQPSLEGYVNLFTTRTRVGQEALENLPPPETWYDEIVRNRDM
ncbi:MAG: carbohydrate ABC transporter permease, partial [Pseudomonadota bacterium]